MTGPSDLASRRAFLRASILSFAGLGLTGCAPDGAEAPAGAASDAPTAGATGTTGTGDLTVGTGVAPDVTAPTDVVAVADPVTIDVAAFDALPTCTLQPELTEGPFALADQFVRRDVTEGVPGHPVRLGLRVVDDTCAPLPGAVVEVWHTDASGDYSAFADGGDGKDEGDGTTFCRGTQVADERGVVEFRTIWPGWYPGRCVHYHVRVHVDGTRVLATQLVFRDEETSAVFAEAPYAQFGDATVPVTEDFLSAAAATDGTYLVTYPGAGSDTPDGTTALLNLAVDPGVA